MKRSVTAVIIASLVILATDLRAQESVCDHFSDPQKSDGHQLALSGDLIISKENAVLGAADCDHRHESGDDIGRAWPTALDPSIAVAPIQRKKLPKTAAFGTLRVRSDHHVSWNPNATDRAYGYGHIAAQPAAALMVENIRDFDLTEWLETPTDPKQVNAEQESTPPSRAELCAKADTLPRAAQRDCADKVRKLLAANGIDSKNGSESEALITAIRAGKKDIVEILLQAGAPVNPSQTALWPPLSDAAFSKHFDIMKLLLQSGAKVDAPDHHGDTLLVSTGFFDPTVTTILLEAGANPNASDREGQTALMKAAARGGKQSVRILLDHHADVNRKDAKGRTALMHAAASSFSDAIPVLLENGADPNARDHEGKSALDLADNYNNLGAFAMLSLAVKRSH